MEIEDEFIYSLIKENESRSEDNYESYNRTGSRGSLYRSRRYAKIAAVLWLALEAHRKGVKE